MPVLICKMLIPGRKISIKCYFRVKIFGIEMGNTDVGMKNAHMGMERTDIGVEDVLMGVENVDILTGGYRYWNGEYRYRRGGCLYRTGDSCYFDIEKEDTCSGKEEAHTWVEKVDDEWRMMMSGCWTLG